MAPLSLGNWQLPRWQRVIAFLESRLQVGLNNVLSRNPEIIPGNMPEFLFISPKGMSKASLVNMRTY